jgi:hypothetical protein
LIDEHEDFVTCHGILECGDERPELRRCLAVPCKQNEAARPRSSKELPLCIVERDTRTAGDKGLEVHGAG